MVTEVLGYAYNILPYALVDQEGLLHLVWGRAGKGDYVVRCLNSEESGWIGAGSDDISET